MRKIRIIVFTLLLLILNMNVMAYTHRNDYKGRTYDDYDEKSLKELEEKLRDDGYICITPTHSDNEKISNALINEPAFAGYQYISYGVDYNDYYVFILDKDYKEYERTGDINDLNYDTVVVDYYCINHSNEAGASTGYIDENIPENVEKGTLCINVNNSYLCKELGLDDNNFLNEINIKENEDNILSDKQSLPYRFVFYEVNRNEYFSVDKYIAPDNNEIYVELPTGNYYVYEAFFHNDYVADVRAYKDEGFDVNKDTVTNITVPFLPKSDVYAKELKEPENKKINGYETKDIAMGDTTITQYTNVKEKKANKVVNLLIYLAFISIIGTLVILFVRRVKISNNME